MAKLTVEEILSFLERQEIDVTVSGCQDVAIDFYSSLNNLTDARITWVKKWRDEIGEKIENLSNVIIITAKKDINSGRNCYICHDSPKMVFFEIINNFFVDKPIVAISETAVVKTKEVGENVSVGHHSYLGEDVQIGNDVIIGHNVTIMGRVSIGDSCFIESGVVIGHEGLGYYLDIHGNYKRVPHLGGVVIGHHVHIGANSVVDRGTIDDTVIGDYTNVDNLCHIAHNDVIGKNVLIIAGTVLCGSVTIGDGCYIAPNSTIKNQLRVEKDAFIGMHSCVVEDVKNGTSVFGVPAERIKRTYKI